MIYNYYHKALKASHGQKSPRWVWTCLNAPDLFSKELIKPENDAVKISFQHVITVVGKVLNWED